MAEAVRQADHQTVRSLLEKGADPNTRLDGYPAIILAVRSPRILKLLIQHISNLESQDEGTGQTALMHAAMFFEHATTLLLKHGARVNARSHDGTTALISAARYCRTENVRVLLRYGADVQAKNRQGETALSAATSRRRAGFEEYAEIVSLLKDYTRQKFTRLGQGSK